MCAICNPCVRSFEGRRDSRTTRGGVVRFKQPSWYESVLEDVTSAIPFGTVLNKLEASIACPQERRAGVLPRPLVLLVRGLNNVSAGDLPATES